MRIKLPFALGAAVLLAAMACGARKSPSMSSVLKAGVAPPWTSPLDREAPLVGVIWRPSTGARVVLQTLSAELTRADYVLLGEQHDNPDHHVLQATAIAAIVRAGRRPTVALEMLEPDDDAVVAHYRSDPLATADGLGAALGWEKSGWPDWSLYLPIAVVAFGAELPIVSANLPRAVVRDVAHRGLLALPPGTVSDLGLGSPLAPDAEASLEDELRGSHCGQLPESMVAPMALAQRARDGQMANRLLAAPGPAVLIAGAGHVRNDRGVAARLRERKPDARVVSVAFVEVDGRSRNPADYAQRFGTAGLPFDFVWFTPRASDQDPCAGFPKLAK